MSKDEKLLPQIKGAPSRYVTWVDYSMRMKQTTVSVKDYELFFRKYYGFIIGFCRKVYHLDDGEIAEIISKVFHDFIEKKRFQYDRTQGAFHSWFATIISNTIKDSFKSCQSQKVREIKYVKEGPDCVHPDFGDKDDDDLWKGYLVYLAFNAAAEKSSADQIHCFTWKHHNQKKPAEIAEALGISSKQVSENIRAFKNKIRNAFYDLGTAYDQAIDWDTVKQQADKARRTYFEIAESFPIAVEEES